jgi:hypothetical protein
MGYFSDNYERLKFPIVSPRRSGFRTAQIAAIHAISAHFFGSVQPAIVTMPTEQEKRRS